MLSLFSFALGVILIVDLIKVVHDLDKSTNRLAEIETRKTENIKILWQELKRMNDRKKVE